MKSAYIVMAGYDSPIAFVIPSPCAVFTKRKDAEAYCKERNARATRNQYYVRRASFEPTTKD